MKCSSIFLTIFMIYFIAGCSAMPEILKPISPSPDQTEKGQGQYVTSDDAFESVEGEPKMPEPPLPAEQLKESLLLGNAKRDLEAYRLYAKHLHQHNEFDDLEILEGASEAYIKEYVDDLLAQEASNPNYETIRLSVVILFTKAMLLYEFNQIEEVDAVMDELKSQYSQYYDIAVNHFGYEVIRDTIEKFEGMSKRKIQRTPGKKKPSGEKAGSSQEEEKPDEEMEKLLENLVVG